MTARLARPTRFMSQLALMVETAVEDEAAPGLLSGCSPDRALAPALRAWLAEVWLPSFETWGDPT